MINIHYRKGHIPALDGVRGCAIVLVLIFHCLKTSILPFSLISGIGWVGVNLFFVLSGFLITGILIDTKGGKNNIITFYLKRVLRIFPLYYLALFIFFIVLLIPGIEDINSYLDSRYLDDIFYFLTYTQNIRFAFKGWGVTDILNHFWSLAIEEQFYLFWPFVIMIAKNNKIILISIVFVLTSLIIRNIYPENPYSYVFTLARFDALAIGSISAILIRKNIPLLNKYLLYTFIITLAILTFVILLTQSVSLSNVHFVKYGYTLFDILFASSIILIFDTKRIGTITSHFFNARFLRFLGKYSYGIYVYHWLLYRGLYTFLEAKFSLAKIYIFPFLAVVILTSVLSYHLYEKRFLKYKSRINEDTDLRNLLSLKRYSRNS